jgi:hypothetical protein
MCRWLSLGLRAARNFCVAIFAHGLAVAITFVQTNLLWAQDAASLERFLNQYRCSVVDRLERIYAKGDPVTQPDKYLIVHIPPRPEHYVQCVFYAPAVYCEVASGFFFEPSGQPRTMYLPPDAIGALGRLGFSTDDSNGNFEIEFDVADPPNFNAIADLMLKALYDGFGARAGTELAFEAPYARHATSKCVPVS